MKFVFPFTCYEPDEAGGTRLNHDTLSIDLKPKSKPRFVRKAIKKVIMDRYGIHITSEEAMAYYKAGCNFMRGAYKTAEAAEKDMPSLSDEDMAKFIKRRQEVAEGKLRKIETRSEK